MTLGAGATRGALQQLVVAVDAPDIEGQIDDLAAAVGGTLIPYAKPFTVIKNIQITLQSGASTATIAEPTKPVEVGSLSRNATRQGIRSGSVALRALPLWLVSNALLAIVVVTNTGGVPFLCGDQAIVVTVHLVLAGALPGAVLLVVKKAIPIAAAGSISFIREGLRCPGKERSGKKDSCGVHILVSMFVACQPIAEWKSQPPQNEGGDLLNSREPRERPGWS